MKYEKNTGEMSHLQKNNSGLIVAKNFELHEGNALKHVTFFQLIKAIDFYWNDWLIYNKE